MERTNDYMLRVDRRNGVAFLLLPPDTMWRKGEQLEVTALVDGGGVATYRKRGSVERDLHPRAAKPSPVTVTQPAGTPTLRVRVPYKICAKIAHGTHPIMTQYDRDTGWLSIQIRKLPRHKDTAAAVTATDVADFVLDDVQSGGADPYLDADNIPKLRSYLQHLSKQGD